MTTKREVLMQCSVMLRHPKYGALSIPLHRFRKLLTDAEVKDFTENRCVSCGREHGKLRYDGGCGRELCHRCGKREDAPVLQHRSKP